MAEEITNNPAPLTARQVAEQNPELNKFREIAFGTNYLDDIDAGTGTARFYSGFGMQPTYTGTNTDQSVADAVTAQAEAVAAPDQSGGQDQVTGGPQLTESGTFGGNPTYSDDGSTVDTDGNITKADGTYGGNIVDEFGESGDVYSDVDLNPTPTFTAPAPGPVYYDYSNDGDSGSQSDSQSGADESQSASDEDAGAGGYAVGGIVRLRKNKQNSRIHDRRKRLAIGGIASLHG